MAVLSPVATLAAPALLRPCMRASPPAETSRPPVGSDEPGTGRRQFPAPATDLTAERAMTARPAKDVDRMFTLSPNWVGSAQDPQQTHRHNNNSNSNSNNRVFWPSDDAGCAGPGCGKRVRPSANDERKSGRQPTGFLRDQERAEVLTRLANAHNKYTHGAS
eukprot:jgi/Chlat1/5730/Chrsp38S05531